MVIVDAPICCGGRLKEIPLPHVRQYPKFTPWPVRISIQCYPSAGRHYWVTVREYPNPLWNSAEEHWQESWDDKGARGKIVFGGPYDRLSQAIAFVEETVKAEYSCSDWEVAASGGESLEEYLQRHRENMSATGPFFYDKIGD